MPSHQALSPAMGGDSLTCVSSSMNRINHTVLDDKMQAVKKNALQSKTVHESKENILHVPPHTDEMFYLFVCEEHLQASLLPQP